MESREEDSESGGTADSSQSSSSSRGPRKTSQVWNHFTTIDLETAKCKTCRTVIKTKFSSTSSLRRHLQTHPEIFATLDSVKKATDGLNTKHTITKAFERQTPLDSKSPKAHELTKAIAVMIAVDLQPYSVVEDPGFKAVLKIAEPRYVIPSRTTFSRNMIPKMYQDERSRISQALQQDVIQGR